MVATSSRRQGIPGPSGGVSPAQYAQLKTGWRFTETPSQSTSDTPTSSNSASYSDAMAIVRTLPAGTWTVEVSGEIEARNNSIGAQTFMRVTINAQAGSEYSPGHASGDGYQHMTARHSRADLSGQVILRVQFHPAEGQNVTVRNPRLIVTYTRTA